MTLWSEIVTPVLEGIRGLLVTAFVAAFGYSFATSASRGMCGDGAPPGTSQCATLTLAPSPFVDVALALIVYVAIRRAAARSSELADAERTFTLARRAIVITVAVAAVIAHAWFWATPFDQWGTPGGISSLNPLLVGSINVEFSTS